MSDHVFPDCPEDCWKLEHRSARMVIAIRNYVAAHSEYSVEDVDVDAWTDYWVNPGGNS